MHIYNYRCNEELNTLAQVTAIVIVTHRKGKSSYVITCFFFSLIFEPLIELPLFPIFFLSFAVCITSQSSEGTPRSVTAKKLSDKQTQRHLVTQRSDAIHDLTNSLTML